MGFKEQFEKFKEKRNKEKEEFADMERRVKLERKLEQKMKTPAQKEHEFYQREKEQEKLQSILKKERKEREEKLKNLSNPFNKKDLFHERNDLTDGNVKWI